MENTSSWQKIITTRRYLHPPKSERLFTLWSEGKITYGDVLPGADDGFYDTLTSCGIWLAYGESDEQFDFKTAKQTVFNGYIPVHSLEFCKNGTVITLEAFCDTERLTTCFARITVKNITSEIKTEKLSIYVRNGNEKQLIFGAPDVYTTYEPDINIWKNVPSTYTLKDNNTLCDNDLFVNIFADNLWDWDEKNGTARFVFTLAPSEEKTITLSIGKGKALPLGYDYERNKTITFWEREITRIKKFPKGIKPTSDKITMIKSLVAQMLQCFCHYVGSDALIARQGGLQRRTWPGEFFKMLDCLGRIGDFSDYIEPVIAGCFDGQQLSDGEIKPDGIAWASITGCVVHCFAKYCLEGNARFYAKYKDKAYASFKWIKKKRSESKDTEHESAGIFPPMRASDWAQLVQNWAVTDIPTLCGLEFFAKAAEMYGDGNLSEIRSEAEDYRCAIQRLLDRRLEKYTDSDILPIPLSPNDDDHILFNEYRVPRTRVSHFIRYGFVDVKEIPRVIKWLEREDLCQKGLYTRMITHNYNVWYLTEPEESWLVSFMRAGMYDKAKETLDAILNLTVSTEYYTVERYMDNDKYFTPWSPNASGNARIINMLFEYYNVIDE